MDKRARERLELFTDATRFPPYVFSANGNGKLVHRVARLQLRWYWFDDRHRVVRLLRPHMIASCACGQMFHLDEEHRAQLCQTPQPEALLCGRCQGQGPVFGKASAFAQLPTRRAKRQALREAHAKLVGRSRRKRR